MGGATRALTAANNQVNMQSIQNTMMQFQKQTEYMDMADEYLPFFNDSIFEIPIN